MAEALEEAALSGALFKPAERSGSPTRSDISTSSEPDLDTDEELGLNQAPGPGESSSALLPEYEASHARGAQTGIKGVLNDKKSHTLSSRAKARVDAKRVKEGMEKMAIGGNTWEEEEVLRRKEASGDGVEEWRRKRMEEMKGKGGLKEVGKEGFVGAVERKGWVVVLIYEPETPRCQTLLTSMMDLSTTLSSPDTHAHLETPLTLLRARATTLAFSLLPPSNTARREPKNKSHADSDSDEEDEEEVEADPDVLPTILAYRDGELEKKWIRVDWDIGDGNLEGLLRKEGILPKEGFDDRSR